MVRFRAPTHACCERATAAVFAGGLQLRRTATDLAVLRAACPQVPALARQGTARAVVRAQVCMCLCVRLFCTASAFTQLPPLSPPGPGQQAGGLPACTLPPADKAAGASPHGHGYETVLSPHQVRMRVCVAPLCAGGALMCCPPLVALGSVREAGRQPAGGDIETALCRHHALYGILVRVFDPTPGQWDGYTLRACCRRRALHRTLRAAPALACVLQCTRRSVVSRGCPVRSRCRRCGLGRSLATRQ